MANDMRNGGQNSEQNRARRRSFTSIGRATRRPGARTRETLGQRPMSNSVAGQTVQEKAPKVSDTNSARTNNLESVNKVVENWSTQTDDASGKTKNLLQKLNKKIYNWKRLKAKRTEYKERLTRYKEILDEYRRAFDDFTMRLVAKFENALGTRMFPIDKFKYSTYQRVFFSLQRPRSGLKKTDEIKREVKQYLSPVFREIGQNVGSNNDLLDPYTVFSKDMVKLQLLINDVKNYLIKLPELPYGDERNELVRQLKFKCKEIEDCFLDFRNCFKPEDLDPNSPNLTIRCVARLTDLVTSMTRYFEYYGKYVQSLTQKQAAIQNDMIGLIAAVFS